MGRGEGTGGIKTEGIEDGMEGGRERCEDGMEGGRERCTEGKRTMKELEGGVSEEDEGVGRDESEKRVDRGDGFGDDCFR